MPEFITPSELIPNHLNPKRIIPAAATAPAVACANVCFFMTILDQATDPTIKYNHNQFHPKSKDRKIVAADETPV